MRNKGVLIFLFILIIGFILRFYKLGEIPNGLYQDETAIGYNAYSILNTGRDEYGKFLPLYFKSFGDYKLPVYIYSSVVPIKLFSLTPWAVRLPSAIFGFLTIPLIYLVTKRLSKRSSLALTAAFLLAINPWHVHYSRATFEVSISLFLFLVGTLWLTKAREGKSGYFLGAVASFIIALYTYNLTRLLSPVLFGTLYVILFRSGKKPGRRETIASIMLASVGLVPFLVTLLTQGGISSSSGTLIFTSAQVQAPLQELRSYMADVPAILTKILFNTPTLTLWQYLTNIASYLSVPFFFLTGSTHGNHGIGNVGQFYLFELLTIAAGFSLLAKEKTVLSRFAFGWGAVTILVAALTREAPHATRSFFLIVPMVILSAAGLLHLVSRVQSIDNKTHKTAIAAISVLFAAYTIAQYFFSYMVRFPVAYAKAWRSADREAALFLKEHENDYERVIIDKKSGFIYTSLLFYSSFPPRAFQETVSRLPDDTEGFSDVVSFGKYEIKDVSEADFRLPRTLILTTADRKPEFARPIISLYYPKRPVVIAVKGEIVRFPIEEIAYVIVSNE